MSDQVIMLIIVTAIVLIVAVIFIRRALKYRDAVGATVPQEEISIEVIPPEQSEHDVYLMRHICLLHSPFRNGRSVLIRPRYHEWIRKINRSIGGKDTSITEYVDKVLKAHFDDNREVINDLYDKSLNEKAAGNGCG